MSETKQVGLLGTLIERWEAREYYPQGVSDLRDEFVRELQAELAALLPAPPQEQELEQLRAERDQLLAEMRAKPENYPNLLRINREYASRCEAENAELRAKLAASPPAQELLEEISRFDFGWDGMRSANDGQYVQFDELKQLLDAWAPSTTARTEHLERNVQGTSPDGVSDRVVPSGQDSGRLLLPTLYTRHPDGFRSVRRSELRRWGSLLQISPANDASGADTSEVTQFVAVPSVPNGGDSGQVAAPAQEQEPAKG